MAVSDNASSLDNPSIRLSGYKRLAFSFDDIMNGVFVTILGMFRICYLESYTCESCSLQLQHKADTYC